MKTQKKEKKKDFIGEVRKKLGEFSDVMNDFHFSIPDPLESTRSDKTHENVVIEIIGQKKD